MVASTSSGATSITVFGATGAQGGSVLNHLLASDREYRIRAITRDPSKPNAKAIAAKGVDVVKAELGNTDEVEAAVKGQDVVFVSRSGIFWVPLPAIGGVEALTLGWI
jgi:uncharacterized protein YbjT (DUF2867 family)